MASPQQPPPHGHSTLEVDPQFQREQTLPEVDDGRLPQVDDGRLPQVDRAATADLDYPETTGANAGGNAKEPPASGAAVRDGRTCGLRRRVFWMLVAVGILLVAGAIAGAVAGTLTRKHGAQGDNRDGGKKTDDGKGDGGKGDSGKGDGGKGDGRTPIDATALYPGTKLASTSFTDAWRYQNRVIVYQRNDRAIYMSTLNESHGRWVVSPIIDGSQRSDSSLDVLRTSLDDVRLGTSLAISPVGWSENSTPWLQIHWQGPDYRVRKLTQQNTHTDRPSGPKDWEHMLAAGSKDLNVRAAPGSPIIPYSPQCGNCVQDEFIIYQVEDHLMAYRLPQVSEIRQNVTFKRVGSLGQNTSMALVNVPVDRGPARLNLFFRTLTGVLSWVTFDDNQSLTRNLSRGLGPRSSVAAMQGMSDMSGTPILTVLAVDPDAQNKILLSQFFQNEWEYDTRDVAVLDPCAARASLVSDPLYNRLYCVTESMSDGHLEVIEWDWSYQRHTSEFSRIGTADTTIGSR